MVAAVGKLVALPYGEKLILIIALAEDAV